MPSHLLRLPNTRFDNNAPRRRNHLSAKSNMSPDKGAPSSKTYAVEIVVPEDGLGRRLEDMHDFHRQRAITDHYVPGRRDGERDYVRWFFKDLATAEAFAAQFSGTLVTPHSERSNAAWSVRIGEIASAVRPIAMGYARLLYALVPLSLMVVGALVIKQISLREEAKLVAKPPTVAIEAKAPLVKDKTNDARAHANEPSGKPGLTPNCEKELRRTADLLRFFANRIQTGEKRKSIVADMKQQEKRISAVCSD
jgi:hypothetical protein